MSNYRDFLLAAGILVLWWIVRRLLFKGGG